jgi:hypothetical protein
VGLWTAFGLALRAGEQGKASSVQNKTGPTRWKICAFVDIAILNVMGTDSPQRRKGHNQQ